MEHNFLDTIVCGFGSVPEEYKNVAKASPTLLMAYNQSPSHAEAYRNKTWKTTPAMEEGTMIHKWILEKEDFFEDYFIELMEEEKTQYLNTATDLKNACKKNGLPTAGTKTILIERLRQLDESLLFYDDYLEKNAGKKLITRKAHERLLRLQERIDKNAQLKTILKHSEKEKFAYWTDEGTGLLIRMRVDGFICHPKLNMVFDVKKVRDVNPFKFEHDLKSSGKHIQAAMYLDGLSQIKQAKFTCFEFLGVEFSDPVLISRLVPEEAVIEAGRVEYKRLLAKYKQSLIHNEWPMPSYCYGQETISFKAWDWATIEGESNE